MIVEIGANLFFGHILFFLQASQKNLLKFTSSLYFTKLVEITALNKPLPLNRRLWGTQGVPLNLLNKTQIFNFLRRQT